MKNTTNNEFTVTGLFKDKSSAECAYSALNERGYDKDNSDVLMSDETRERYYSNNNADESELGSKALEGSGTGAAIGGTLGAIVGAIAAIGTSVVVPGLGLIVAGPLAAALVGAGAGGLTGGLVGALIGAGIPEEQAEAYEAGIKSGGIVLRANPRTAEDAAFIENKWKECRGEQIYSNAARQTMATANSASGRSTSEMTVPVIEEELQVGKRTVETGGVRVETNIEERPVEKTLTLKEEEINVERRTVNRDVTADDLNKTVEGEIKIPVIGEVPVAAKEARVVEEIVISKNVNERDETISDTVRRTEVEVEDLSGEQSKKNRQTAG